jgi:hypothetical protein
MSFVALGIIVAVGLIVTVAVVLFVRFLDQSRSSSAAVATPAPVPPAKEPTARAPLPTEAEPSERRIAPRRKGSAVSVLVTDEQHPEPYRGWVVDRSTTGLCLELDDAKQPGEILQLKPAEAPQATAWIPAEVRYSRQKGNVHHVGCQFLQTPPWNVLLLFG